jgi:hypothetical protein
MSSYSPCLILEMFRMPFGAQWCAHVCASDYVFRVEMLSKGNSRTIRQW